jgi:hypothetical protein
LLTLRTTENLCPADSRLDVFGVIEPEERNTCELRPIHVRYENLVTVLHAFELAHSNNWTSRHTAMFYGSPIIVVKPREPLAIRKGDAATLMERRRPSLCG